VKRRAISIIRLKRCFIYRPLAAILALLLLPMFSGFEGAAGVRAFQASAGTISGSKQIIQNYCVGSSCYIADLGQLERDAVAGYLGLHNLPSDDTNIIYDLNGEPDNPNFGDIPLANIPAWEAGLYTQVRALAPQTPMTLFSLSDTLTTNAQYPGGIVAFAAAGVAHGISWSNAAFGYHGYASPQATQEVMGQEITVQSSALQAAGVPVYMTEVCESGCSTYAAAYDWFYPGLWNAGISANYLSGDGFCNAATSTCYGNPPSPVDYINIGWPED